MRKERLAGTLTRQNRPLEIFLTEAGFDGAIIRQAIPWCNKLETDARLWMMRGGFASDRGRIDKRTAERVYAQAFGRPSPNGGHHA